MTNEEIISMYYLCQWARMTLEYGDIGTIVQRSKVLQAIGIAEKMSADAGYPGHTQINELIQKTEK